MWSHALGIMHCLGLSSSSLLGRVLALLCCATRLLRCDLHGEHLRHVLRLAMMALQLLLNVNWDTHILTTLHASHLDCVEALSSIG